MQGNTQDCGARSECSSSLACIPTGSVATIAHGIQGNVRSKCSIGSAAVHNHRVMSTESLLSLPLTHWDCNFENALALSLECFRLTCRYPKLLKQSCSGRCRYLSANVCISITENSATFQKFQFREKVNGKVHGWTRSTCGTLWRANENHGDRLILTDRSFDGAYPTNVSTQYGMWWKHLRPPYDSVIAV